MDSDGRMWDKAQARHFAKQLRKRIGPGWAYLVPEVQRAMVDSEVLRILRIQSGEHPITVEAINLLTHDMWEAAGVD